MSASCPLMPRRPRSATRISWTGVAARSLMLVKVSERFAVPEPVVVSVCGARRAARSIVMMPMAYAMTKPPTPTSAARTRSAASSEVSALFICPAGLDGGALCSGP
ncbi:hypothetical protein DEI86_12280 [Curtobacterium sp. MCBD17_028]|nr:hypothetical protein DEI86_12280 [Curtobacterium sp. MCBD17_028]